MSAIARRPEADPLYANAAPERAAYATGMLLDAQDFVDEQTYHRGRLARALALLGGGGTVAGLEVKYRAAAAQKPEEIEVAPGVAIDALGRLVEIQRPACLRLAVWFEGERALDEGDTLRRAALATLERFVSPRVKAAGGLPARAVVADVYVRFVACERGLTPSFAAGPFDALDAVSPSRVRDAYELHLVPRTDGLDDGFSGLPPHGPDLRPRPAPQRAAGRAARGVSETQRLGCARPAAWTPARARHDRGLSRASLHPGRRGEPAGAHRERADRRQLQQTFHAERSVARALAGRVMARGASGCRRGACATGRDVRFRGDRPCGFRSAGVFACTT
jgi:hypothetical protein